MDKEERVLVERSGLVVIGAIERLPRLGTMMECTRSLEVINGNLYPMRIDTVILRGAGPRAATRPPFHYDLLQVIPPGQRMTVVDLAMFERVQGQRQATGAVRPFEERLLEVQPEVRHPPRVVLRVRWADGGDDVEVPVLQLASDALGRLFQVRPVA
jgi:hypothetical protein